MNYLKPMVASVALLIGFVVAPAARAEAAVVTVVAVGVYETGEVLLQFGAGTFNACGCLVVASTSAGRQGILAIATAAKLSGKKIWVNRVTRAPGPWGIADYAADVRLVN